MLMANTPLVAGLLLRLADVLSWYGQCFVCLRWREVQILCQVADC